MKKSWKINTASQEDSIQQRDSSDVKERQGPAQTDDGRGRAPLLDPLCRQGCKELFYLK